MENSIVSMPRIGDVAPAFKAVTTQGEINFQRIMKAVGLYFSAILRILRLSALRSL
jgi:hypothetical protein